MIAIVMVQCICVLFAAVCLGQVIRKDATNFDKIVLGILCFLLLVLCFLFSILCISL